MACQLFSVARCCCWPVFQFALSLVPSWELGCPTNRSPLAGQHCSTPSPLPPSPACYTSRVLVAANSLCVFRLLPHPSCHHHHPLRLLKELINSVQVPKTPGLTILCALYIYTYEVEPPSV